jgi:predicted glycogen debranching enzyme
MNLPTITISSEVLSRFNEAVQKEWLITNGLGGYAASTVLGLNTRKYHGLLVAALNPPGDRTVCLEKLDEDVILGEKIFRLGTNEFQNTIFPQGYQFLRAFSVSPFPTFTYQVQSLTIKKTIFLPQRKNAVIAIYNLLNKSSNGAKFRIFPLLTCRHFHTIVELQKTSLNFHQEQINRKVNLTFTNPNNTIITYSSAGEFVEKPNWVKGLHYREEHARGESDTDNCYQPGYYELSIAPNRDTKIALATIASPNGQEAVGLSNNIGSSTADFEQLFEKTVDEQRHLLQTFYDSQKNVPVTSWLDWILLSANSFVTQESDYGRSVIAGYYWFESWGRDTFISLPGLMLVTGRYDDAKHVLLNNSIYCKKGLIPNIILDASGQALYNTVDATLWYVNSVFQYLKYTADFKFIQDHLWGTLKIIIENHENGTDFDIRLDSDGLLAHGPQLTWMDASVDGKAITPRSEKAVEIQALWYNTLKIMALLANQFGDRNLTEKYVAMADKARKSFNEKFWNPQRMCLFDVLGTSEPDSSLRPNQILATSLDFVILDINKRTKVVDVLQKEFLTLCGLRTLSPNDTGYKRVYKGSMRDRDQAYHNGIVWPWLLGPFVTGFLKTKQPNDQNLRSAMQTIIQGLFERQIYEGGLGTVNEIFDADFPHKPRGCIAQAWSIAEPLRAYIEDVLQIRPRYEKEILNSSV